MARKQQHTRVHWAIAGLLFLSVGSAFGVACAEENFCRYEPTCETDQYGALCQENTECVTNFCCTSDDCGPGMCTRACKGNMDCPHDMLCEHNTCFFVCASDNDCAPGQSCEHGNTICEYGE